MRVNMSAHGYRKMLETKLDDLSVSPSPSPWLKPSPPSLGSCFPKATSRLIGKEHSPVWASVSRESPARCHISFCVSLSTDAGTERRADQNLVSYRTPRHTRTRQKDSGTRGEETATDEALRGYGVGLRARVPRKCADTGKEKKALQKEQGFTKGMRVCCTMTMHLVAFDMITT